RFLHMMRTFKPSSPMNMGTWILGGFGTGAGVVAASEVDRMTAERLPLGPLRAVLRCVEKPMGAVAARLGAPLASYTAALLADTAVPTSHASKYYRSYRFVSYAPIASSGLAMVTPPTKQTRPARALATISTAADLYFKQKLTEPLHPVEAQPLRTGRPSTHL